MQNVPECQPQSKNLWFLHFVRTLGVRTLELLEPLDWDLRLTI